MANSRPDSNAPRLQQLLVSQRDTSRDNALVLRPTSTGTPGSRTVAFVDYCVGTPVDALDEATVLGYAVTRAFFEGGWSLPVHSVELGASATGANRRARLDSHEDSWHHQKHFARPHWQSMATATCSLATSLVEASVTHNLANGPSASTVPSENPAWSITRSAAYRSQILMHAASRMGLPEPPLLTMMDLQRHSYFAERGVFEADDDDEGEQDSEAASGESGRRLSLSGRSSATGAGSKSDAGSVSLASGTGVGGAKRARKRSGLSHLNLRAEREKRLAGTDATTGDQGHDIKGAAVFEWSRSQRGRDGKPSFPKMSEENWLSVKGVVFAANLDRVQDAGRQLYYRMVFIPLYSGRDVTEELARLCSEAEHNPGEVPVETDDFESHDEAAWEAIRVAEAAAGMPLSSGASLTGLHRTYPERDRAHSRLTPGSRRHVDKIFEVLLQDFDVIGALADPATELWL